MTNNTEMNETFVAALTEGNNRLEELLIKVANILVIQ